MPYYVYRINPVQGTLIKNLEKLNEFDNFKEAKNWAREERKNHSSEDGEFIKVIFAQNPLEAEELLSEKREAPILKEWEK